MGDSLTTSFCDMFGIAQVKRRPMREKVSGLYVRTLKLPKSDKTEKVRLLLEQARNAVYGEASSNAGRQKSIDDARKWCDEAEPLLQELESANRQQPEAARLDKRTPTSQDVARAQALHKTLDGLAGKIDDAVAPKGKPQVMMPESLSRMALLGEVEGMRIRIDSGIVDGRTAKLYEAEIKLLDVKIQSAAAYAEEQRRIAGEYMTWGVETGQAALDRLEPVMKLDRLDTPLFSKLDALFDAVDNKALLNPPAWPRLKAEVEKELAKVGTDYAGYAKSTRAAAAEAQRVKKGLETFNAKVGPKLEELRVLGEPFGGESYRALMLQADQARSTIAQPVEPRKPAPDPGKLAADVVAAIDVAIDAVRQQAASLRQDVTNERKALDAEIDKVKATRTETAFAADWKQIDAMTASIDQQIPQGETTGEGIANLASVRPLMQSALKLAQAMQTVQATVTGFDGRLADLEKRIEDTGAKGEPLKEYFEKDLTTISADLEKLKKAVPNTKAKANAASLTKLTQTFDDKLKEAAELAKYIKDTVEPNVESKTALYREANGSAVLALLPGRGLPTPNALQAALDAVAKELKRRPPVDADLKRSVQGLTDAFKDIKNADDVARIAAASNIEKKDQAKSKKEQDAATRRELEKRLYGLKLLLDEARAAVKEAKGDKNAIAAIERLCEEAASHIDAVKPDEANRAMDRMQQRIDLVLSNPIGEAARKRNELPKLYEEWRASRRDAANNLGELVAKIGEYQPKDEQSGKAVEELVSRIEAYRARFADDKDSLAPLIGVLANQDLPDAGRRRAREDALGRVLDQQRAIQAHPLTRLLAQSPIAAGRVVPLRLFGGLDRMHYTILTSVE